MLEKSMYSNLLYTNTYTYTKQALFLLSMLKQLGESLGRSCKSTTKGLTIELSVGVTLFLSQCS